MDYNCIVDCHIHVLTKEDFNLYMKTACADKYINIRGLYIDEILDPYNFADDFNKYPRILAIKMYFLNDLLN